MFALKLITTLNDLLLVACNSGKIDEKGTNNRNECSKCGKVCKNQQGRARHELTCPGKEELERRAKEEADRQAKDYQKRSQKHE